MVWEQSYKPRWLANKLRTAAEFSPVIVLSGARQTGKSTLLRNELPFREWHYVTFDELDVLALAQKKPDEILSISPNLVIDEVQKAPEFLHAVKKAVDLDRSRRLVLSGSAKLLLLRKVTESLAGRAVYFDLMPFTGGELRERPYTGWLDRLVATGRLALPLGEERNEQPAALENILFRGFLPPVTLLEREEHVSMWWKGYIKTYLERDLRDVSEISNLPDFRKAMGLLALRTAQLLKQSDVARDTGLSHSTLGRYINVLEETGLLARVRPYAGNIAKRLIKAPKLFITDPGLAAALAGFPSAASLPAPYAGALLESYVYLALTVIAALSEGEVLYFRTQGGREREVDFVFERGRSIVGIEVKKATAVTLRDAENLLYLKDATDRFAAGLIVYCGDGVRQLASNIYAVPWTML